MFHIKQIELVHWDYWRRFTLPLDAQIITIVGPNGSGKTTLLDALRTLFALRCSGKRDFRRYVRRAERSFAWIRATVANAPGATGRRPFFPCMDDVVTLACRIRRAGGEWTRDYTIVDGDEDIETLEQINDWIGLRDYQSRLAAGGLTPAIAKVLALEQGDTDKLCEYAPKALLELVFDVFGDKEVLDNYAVAREEQQNAERELDSLGVDLDRLRAQAEAKRLAADRYLEWKQLTDEAQALAAEVVPRLEAHELRRDIRAERAQLRELDTERRSRHQGLAAARQRIVQVEAEKAAEEQARTQARARHLATEKQHLAAHDRLRDLEHVLRERDRLREVLAREDGQDAAAIEAEHERLEAELGALRVTERDLIARFESAKDALAAARERRGAPGDAEVRDFRAQLEAAGIAHRALAECIEVTDPAWQAAIEAVLRPYRHVLLLDRAADRHRAWALGEAARFRHFVVADCEAAPPPPRGTLAEVVRFAGEAPRWLFDLLGRIHLVEDVAAGSALPRDAEWITRDAYHRERRGARHLGRPREFHFGELARQARISQLTADVAEIDAALSPLRPQMDRLRERLNTVRGQLLGLSAAPQLAARAEAFAAAADALPEARAALTAAIGVRAELQGTLDAIGERLNGIQIELDRRRRELATHEQRLAELNAEHLPRRQSQHRRVQRLRALRRGMPGAWIRGEGLTALGERYGDSRSARAEAERLRARLAQGEWVIDPSVLTLRDRLVDDLDRRERDYTARQGYCATARRHSDEARAAYIAKLRATVRQYARNLKALGELAHVGVECPPPVLENDDAALTGAGLEVRFDFDRKGAVGLNDGEASGGQQVMKSLILLIALLMDEARPGGFVFIDEPFAHLDVANIDRVGSFLRATRAQYLITTPVTHNANVFAPAQLTLVTRKKPAGTDWAPPIGVLQRQID